MTKQQMKEQFRWTIKKLFADRIAKSGVSAQAPDSRQIATAKAAYATENLHERINRRGGR